MCFDHPSLGDSPWLMRWSDRHPLKRDDGMATNQGITLNIQPWRGEHNITEQVVDNSEQNQPGHASNESRADELLAR